MKRYLLVLFILFPASIFCQITASFTQLNIACSSQCKGTMQLEVTGGHPPYQIDWKGVETDPSNDYIGINLCGGMYEISITDELGNILDTTYKVDVLKAPKLSITTIPGDTLYIQNPDIQFFFENIENETNPIIEWLWDFGDYNKTEVASPVHTYSAVNNYFATLKIKYKSNCDTIYSIPIKVKTVDLFIPNIITPNGDGVNDQFIITSKESKSGTSSGNSSGYSVLNEFYISNELIIKNRWGQTVFSTSNYNNDWDGGNLSDGAYFYILKCHGKYKDDIFKGAISILGKGK